MLNPSSSEASSCLPRKADRSLILVLSSAGFLLIFLRDKQWLTLSSRLLVTVNLLPLNSLAEVGLKIEESVRFGDILRCLEDLSPGQELSIPVSIQHLPLLGQSIIDIKLCDIFGNADSRYSISGCPYTFGDEESVVKQGQLMSPV
jgi:hypothetical protein